MRHARHVLQPQRRILTTPNSYGDGATGVSPDQYESGLAALGTIAECESLLVPRHPVTQRSTPARASIASSRRLKPGPISFPATRLWSTIRNSPPSARRPACPILAIS